MTKLGIGSYAFAWAIGIPGYAQTMKPMGLLGFLDRVIELGVSVMQICDNLPLDRQPPELIEEFKKRVAENQIEVEVGTRGLDPQGLLRYLELASEFNSPFVRLVIDSSGDEPTPEEAIARLHPIVAEYAAAGIPLAIENHDRYPAAVLANLVEQLGPEHVGVCLDTVNSFGSLEGPEAVVNTLNPYVLSLHVKEFDIRRMNHNLGFVIEGRPTGQGRINVPWMMETLKMESRGINAILEAWPPPEPDMEATRRKENDWAEASIRYLRTLIPH